MESNIQINHKKGFPYMDISAFTFRFSKKLFFRTWCTPQMQLSIKPNRSTYTHNGKFFTIYCEFGELFSGGNPHPILFVSTSLTGIQSGFAPILFIHFMVFIHGTASTRQMKKKTSPNQTDFLAINLFRMCVVLG